MKETKGKTLHNFKIVSLKNNIQNFGPGFYKEPMNTILIQLINNFEDKFSRKYKKLDRNDLVKLIMLYISILKEKIDTYVKNSKSDSKKSEFKKELYFNKKLFYLLKHHYRLLSVYNLINYYIKDPNKREEAYKCCGKNKHKDKCLYFRSGKKVRILINGFNKFGYVKDTKCTPEYDRSLYENQQKLLNIRLNEINEWNKVDLKVKNFIII